MTQQAAPTSEGPTAVIEPVRATVTVEASKERAFEVFTSGMSSWWPVTHKIGAADLAAAVLEPRVGGRWYEKGTDGSECQWGQVVAYEPPDRLVLLWQISAQWAYDPELVTELEIRFVAEDEGRTRVELEHRNLERYGAAAAEIRATFASDGGWAGLLRGFAERAAA